MEQLVSEIKKALHGYSFPLYDEIETHLVMEKILKKEIPSLVFKREHTLSKTDRIDFFFPDYGLGIEVKVKGQANEILKQLERYVSHEEVKAILYVSSYFIGLPETLSEKPVYSHHLSRGML